MRSRSRTRIGCDRRTGSRPRTSTESGHHDGSDPVKVRQACPAGEHDRLERGGLPLARPLTGKRAHADNQPPRLKTAHARSPQNRHRRRRRRCLDRHQLRDRRPPPVLDKGVNSVLTNRLRCATAATIAGLSVLAAARAAATTPDRDRVASTNWSSSPIRPVRLLVPGSHMPPASRHMSSSSMKTVGSTVARSRSTSSTVSLSRTQLSRECRVHSLSQSPQ